MKEYCRDSTASLRTERALLEEPSCKCMKTRKRIMETGGSWIKLSRYPSNPLFNTFPLSEIINRHKKV